MPLSTIVKTCSHIERSNQLLQIEQAFHGKTDIRLNMRLLIMQSKLMMFSIRDLKDF